MHAVPRVRAHNDLTVHGRQGHGRQGTYPSRSRRRVTAADHPTSVRNVVRVGPSGSGKTTLVEALALTAGAVNRAGRVEDGGCVSDYDDMEHRQQRSVQLSLVPVEWDGIKINLLDTPGVRRLRR
ncbi:Peptide chain release factor 3 [Streptomyces violaceorubidus]